MLRRAADRVPTLVGVKYTAPTTNEFQTLQALDEGRFDILHGRDEMLLAGVVSGAAGAVGSTYNFAAGLYHRMIAAVDRGDLREARRCQALSVAMIRIILGCGGQAGLQHSAVVEKRLHEFAALFGAFAEYAFAIPDLESYSEKVMM